MAGGEQTEATVGAALAGSRGTSAPAAVGQAGAPLVTIVMPAYNRADLIGESIESALAQTYPHFELLVVDDGSSDGTREVARRYAERDRRVRVLEGAHAGMSATMNRGVGAARGTFYARLDSDDLWDRRFLEVTVAAMQASPAAGVVYPRARTFSSRPGVPQADRGRPMTFPDRHFHSMLLGDHASGAALVRVECHQRIGGYDAQLGLWEDWDFWLRLSRYYPLQFVDEVLAYLRVHAGNVSAGGAERWPSRVRVLDKVFASSEALPEGIIELRGQAYCNVYFEVGRAYWAEAAYSEAWDWFQKGLAASPEPMRAFRTLSYSLSLHHLGRIPYFWRLHGALAKARRELRRRTRTSERSR